MEIISYIRQGAITHKDSKGNQGRTSAGNVQVMSAGSGIYHSEYNLESEDTIMYQIWIEPHTQNVSPAWGSITFPEQLNKDTLPLLVSGRQEHADHDVLHIHQHASIYGGRIEKNASINHSIKDQAYILISAGTVEIDGTTLNKGDSAEITDTTHVHITAITESKIVLIDAPKHTH